MCVGGGGAGVCGGAENREGVKSGYKLTLGCHNHQVLDHDCCRCSVPPQSGCKGNEFVRANLR